MCSVHYLLILQHFLKSFVHGLECGCRHLNVLLWAPGPQKVQKRKNFSRHPGGELTSSCRCSVPTLSTNHIQGPTGPSRALRFLRLRIFSSNQGPVWALKTRALYKDQSQRDQHLVTDNVPTLTVSSHNVPTLVMFAMKMIQITPIL